MEFFGRTASVYAGGKTSNGNAPYGDGGPKEAATFHRPEAMDFGPDGSLYISEFPPVGWGVVRKISPNGIVTRIAGVYGNDPGWEHDGRPANELGLASPLDLDVDPWGNVVICGDNGGEVTLVDPAGHGTWIVEQQALAAPRGDGDLAVNANLKSCDGVVRTSDGTVFIADKDDRRIRRIGADGIITTAVGGGTMTTEGKRSTRCTTAPSSRTTSPTVNAQLTATFLST